MIEPVTSARAITRRAKSNLAFALASLPEERRRDMITFYAFCRVVDDIADDESVPVAQREAGLEAWRQALSSPILNENPLAPEVRALMWKYQIPPSQLDDILRGVEMDLRPQRFETAGDLEHYCHLVASVVGLVSIEIFGYRDARCRDYALSLGLALQWTNILRDVTQDARNGRLYLPLADLRRFGLTEADILASVSDARFLALMDHEYHRAEAHFHKAFTALPRGDRQAMVAAETMRKIYHALLKKMRADGFKVHLKRYSLGRPHKVWLMLATRLGWGEPHGPA